MLNLAQMHPYLNQQLIQEELELQLNQNNSNYFADKFQWIQILPSFGVHPWYTQREKDNKQWLQNL